MCTAQDLKALRLVIKTTQGISSIHLPSKSDTGEIHAQIKPTPSTVCSPCCHLPSDAEGSSGAPPDFFLFFLFFVFSSGCDAAEFIVHPFFISSIQQLRLQFPFTTVYWVMVIKMSLRSLKLHSLDSGRSDIRAVN